MITFIGPTCVEIATNVKATYWKKSWRLHQLVVSSLWFGTEYVVQYAKIPHLLDWRSSYHRMCFRCRVLYGTFFLRSYYSFDATNMLALNQHVCARVYVCVCGPRICFLNGSHATGYMHTCVETVFIFFLLIRLLFLSYRRFRIVVRWTKEKIFTSKNIVFEHNRCA